MEKEKITTNDIAMAAVISDPANLQYVKNKTPEICMEAVKRCGAVIKYVDNKTPEICMTAVKQDGRALCYIEKQTEEMCLEAIKNDIRAFDYVKHKTPKICLEAVKLKGSLYEEIVNLNFDNQEDVLSNADQIIEKFNKSTEHDIIAFLTDKKEKGLLDVTPGEIYLALQRARKVIGNQARADKSYKLADNDDYDRYTSMKRYTSNQIDDRHLPFIVRDMIGVANNLGFDEVYMLNYSFPIDSNMINDIVKNRENDIIFTTAAVSTEAFPESKYYCSIMGEPEVSEKIDLPFDEVVGINCKILESLGFVDINNFVNYQFQRAYIYKNEAGKKVLKKIKEIINK